MKYLGRVLAAMERRNEEMRIYRGERGGEIGGETKG